jgi:hypothetical protein
LHIRSRRATVKINAEKIQEKILPRKKNTDLTTKIHERRKTKIDLSTIFEGAIQWRSRWIHAQHETPVFAP